MMCHLENQGTIFLGILFLKGRDGIVWKDHVCNFVSCHLPHIDGRIDPSLPMVHASINYMLYRAAKGIATMLVQD
jgi:hypothetical protein